MSTPAGALAHHSTGLPLQHPKLPQPADPLPSPMGRGRRGAGSPCPSTPVLQVPSRLPPSGSAQAPQRPGCQERSTTVFSTPSLCTALHYTALWDAWRTPCPWAERARGRGTAAKPNSAKQPPPGSFRGQDPPPLRLPKPQPDCRGQGQGINPSWSRTPESPAGLPAAPAGPQGARHGSPAALNPQRGWQRLGQQAGKSRRVPCCPESDPGWKPTCCRDEEGSPGRSREGARVPCRSENGGRDRAGLAARLDASARLPARRRQEREQLGGGVLPGPACLPAALSPAPTRSLLRWGCRGPWGTPTRARAQPGPCRRSKTGPETRPRGWAGRMEQPTGRD